MKKNKFEVALRAAVAGDPDALETMLKLYEPLINKHCFIDGMFDEDLRQYIMIHVVLNIGKFPVQ